VGKCYQYYGKWFCKSCCEQYYGGAPLTGDTGKTCHETKTTTKSTSTKTKKSTNKKEQKKAQPKKGNKNSKTYRSASFSV